MEQPKIGVMLRDITSLALPVTLAQAFQTLGGFINSLMLARVNASAFAAGMLTTSIQLAIVTVSISVLFALSASFSQILGEDTQPERVGRLFSGGVVLALLIAGANMLLLWNVRPIFQLFEQPEVLTELCERYFRIFLWSVPASALLALYSQLLMGTFKQKVVVFSTIFSLVMGAGCSYVLIFGKLGFPALGIEGLAWGSLIASVSGFFGLTIYILTRREYRVYRLLRFELREVRRAVGQIANVGLPISVQMGNELLAFLVTTIMVGWLGVEALAAKQVMTRYLMLLILPIFGLSQATAVLIGRQFGARDLLNTRSYAGICMMLGVAYSLIVLAVFCVAPEPFIGIFLPRSTSVELNDIIARLLVIMAIGQVFDAIRNVAIGALRGLQITKPPMLVGVLSLWIVATPLSYLMGFTWNLGLVGMAWAHTLALGLGAALLLVEWSRVVRRYTAVGPEAFPPPAVKAS
jgi:multidrug resistance protein, MATE family